ncbi:unnamed protein product [Coregonus sp. 'balchen']|nr:unnamed protein product [Coregonus sp. 'balchen']
MGIMAAKCCAGGLFLVLLFWGVHCYPYQQAYKTGPVYRRPPTLYGPPVKPSQNDAYARYYFLTKQRDPTGSGSSLPGPVESGHPIEGGSSPVVQSFALQKTAASPHLVPEQTRCVPAGTTHPSTLPLRPLCESPPIKFQAGDISHFESVYEHGNSQSESEDQQFPLPEVEAGSIPAPLPAIIAPPLPRVHRPEPSKEGLEANYGELFIAGKFPAGTITHFRTNYAHGNEQWSSAGFVRFSMLAWILQSHGCADC